MESNFYLAANKQEIKVDVEVTCNKGHAFDRVKKAQKHANRGKLISGLMNH